MKRILLVVACFYMGRLWERAIWNVQMDKLKADLAADAEQDENEAVITQPISLN